MKYKVLYRKYRPTDFENIIGQDYIIKTLKNSIITNHISHAYIFSGPRGTGKTTTAKVFAKTINCLNPKDGSPCGECEFCRNYQDNPDIIEIDAASNNGVEEIRNLIENIKLTPSNGKYKVYIIDEVHMLSTSAFNALLLTLEEPPSHSIFILATTNIESVPITILSRCQRFDFQKIKIEDIVKRLKEISKIEEIKITDDALEEIAYLSEGGMRDALSLLDQLSKSSEEITVNLIEKQIKTISQKGIIELLDTLENNDIKRCLELINEYRNRAVDYKTLAKKIIDIASNKAKNIKMTGHIKQMNFNEYKELVLQIADSLNKININVDPYTILEMIFLEFFKKVIQEISEEKINNVESSIISNTSNMSNISNNTDSINNNKELENKEDNTNEVTVDINVDKIKIRINNCFVNAQKKYLTDAKEMLEDYLITLSAGKIKSIMTDSQVVAASDTNLIMVVNNEHNMSGANNMLKEIENSLKKVVNIDYKLIFITNEMWLKEKNEYINNLKNKKVYTYMEDNEEEKEEAPMINDVFDISKVEIV